MLIPFGFYKDNTGTIRVDNEKAGTVKLIFELYLNGFSLKRITEHLAEKHILSPTGKDKWTVQAIDNLLSNEKYLRIIPTEQFVKAQLEKQKRSNITSDHTRKTARYHSENVLSGLLVCGECGRNFRRITRKDGEIVWRCADRVENGKQAVCQNLHTVSDAEVKKAICDFLETDQFADEEVKRNIYRIEIDGDGIHCISKTEQLFDMYM